MPDGMRINATTFWLFAQRVAWGDARPEEVALMDKVFDLIDKMGDWKSGTNDYMSENGSAEMFEKHLGAFGLTPDREGEAVTK